MILKGHCLICLHAFFVHIICFLDFYYLFSLDACSTNFKNYTLICRIDSEVQVDSSCSATHHHESGGIFLFLFCSFPALCLSLLWPYCIFRVVMEVYEMNRGQRIVVSSISLYTVL